MKISEDRFEGEKNYSVTMHIAKNLLDQNLINKKEYQHGHHAGTLFPYCWAKIIF